MYGPNEQPGQAWCFTHRHYYEHLDGCEDCLADLESEQDYQAGLPVKEEYES